MKEMYVALHPDCRADFTNNAAYCVGTGRMGLALSVWR